MPLVAPSPIAVRADREPPIGLDEQGIERVISCFVEAARRAAEAGFGAVEIHAAHGYLASQFLSPLANRRTDRWGGALESRARFLREILARIRAAVPSTLVAYCRLGAADEGPGGLSLAEGIMVAGLLARDGVPLLHVSSGIGNPPKMPADGDPWSDRMRLGIEVRRAVALPVIGVGAIRRPQEAEALLSSGLVDLVAVGRGLLADPGWATKSARGEDEAISVCRDCRVCSHFRHAERCPARPAAG